MITPDKLTCDIVQRALAKVRANREMEYLCRAYLQFGPEAMSDVDLRKLCDRINRTTEP